MKKFLLIFYVVGLTACSSIEIKKPLCPGTREYDIQLCRGEKPLQIPNPPGFAFQQRDKCNKCIDIDQNCVWGVPKHCEPKQWR